MAPVVACSVTSPFPMAMVLDVFQEAVIQLITWEQMVCILIEDLCQRILP